MKIQAMPEEYLTNAINGLAGPDVCTRGESPGNLSFWNPGAEYKAFMSERISVPVEKEVFDYLYSYTLDVTKPFLVRLGAGGQVDVERTFTGSSTVSIALTVNLLKTGGIRRLCILAPSYFNVESCCRVFGLEHEVIPLVRNGAGWQIPVARVLEGKFDAIWLTSPVYGTGEEFSDETLGDVLRLRDDCKFTVVFDESLALPGQELVRRVNVDDSTVFIYSPHKAISVNSCKFSAIVCHSQYKEIVDDATDVFGGAMSRSSVGAVHHYLSDNYHEVCVPAYRDFVRRREEDLAAVLAAFPRARVVPNGSGHYRTIITGIRMPDDRHVVEMVSRIRERTGFLFYPGTVTGFPREFGLSFRVNLLQDRVNVREGLASVLSALEDER